MCCNHDIATDSLSVRPLYCLAAIIIISRQASVNRRRRYFAATLSASKRRCAVVCCTHDIVTGNLSVCPSCCPAASRLSLCFTAVKVICLVSYVRTFHDVVRYRQQSVTSSVTGCQLTDTTKGLRTRPALRRQHFDDKEELLSTRTATPRFGEEVKSEEVKR